jgi:hypothetical protein
MEGKMEVVNETKTKKGDLLGNSVELNLQNTLISERNEGNFWQMRIGQKL